MTEIANQNIDIEVVETGGDTAQYFWHEATGPDAGAHVTEVPQEEWSDAGDPNYHSGGNVLVKSTAVSVRDGMKDLAVMSKDGFDAKTYDAQDNEIIIAHLGYGEGRDDNDGTATAPYYTLGRRGTSTTAYSSSRTYDIGDLCVYDNKVYVCIVQMNSPEQWTPSHWKYYIGNYSLAEGLDVIASGVYSHAEGFFTIASGNYSHAEGDGTIASGNQSHAEGWATTARGVSSHAEGYETIASGNQSHAEGFFTIASGHQSHAEGYETIASGNDSHAEGDGTIASGNQSHAEGYETIASGNDSHAEGWYTRATGNYSHAQNYETRAMSDYQTAIGKYNDNNPDNAFEIGNGTSEHSTKNAFTVDWQGGAAFGNVSRTFMVKEYTHPFSALSSGNAMNWSDVVSEPGYIPIGVVGFRTSMNALLVNMCRLTYDSVNDEYSINMNARAVASVSAGTASMNVLWIKET